MISEFVAGSACTWPPVDGRAEAATGVVDCAEAPLLPAGHPIDLFVTATDFRGHMETLRLNSPALVEGDHLMRFDVVVANPPFSLDKWGAEHAGDDP